MTDTQRKKEKAALIVAGLEKEYPEAICSLVYEKPYELLISTRLSAQCTDARVNIVTKELFEVYPTLEAFTKASPEEIEKIIRPCGLGNTKARDIAAMTKMLAENYNSIVPDNLDELLKLPGVGRKTANLIIGDVFKKPAIVCDTHCIRITNLLGLSVGKNAAVVEKQLKEVLEPEKSNDFCHRLVLHGRAVCKAGRPDCKNCCVKDYCDYALGQLS